MFNIYLKNILMILKSQKIPTSSTNVLMILRSFSLTFGIIKVGTESTAPSAAPSAAFVIKQEMH